MLDSHFDRSIPTLKDALDTTYLWNAGDIDFPKCSIQSTFHHFPTKLVFHIDTFLAILEVKGFELYMIFPYFDNIQ